MPGQCQAGKKQGPYLLLGWLGVVGYEQPGLAGWGR